MNIFDPHITGSLSVSASAHIEGDLTVLGTIFGTAEIEGTVDNAISASHASSYLLTSSFEGVSGSFAITGSNNFKGNQTFSGSLLPEGTLTHDLGSDSKRWNDIYLAGSTIDIGGTKISKNSDGDIQLHDSGNTLKKLIASEIELGHGANKKVLKISNGRLKLMATNDTDEELAQLSGSFTGSFRGDGSGLTNVPASGVTGLSLDSISSGSNSLEMGSTVLVSNVSILPNITDTIDLGSPDKQWRDLFLSSGSLYINGQQVISTTGNELRITTDTGESIKIIETDSDTITLQTEDGDITLSSSGGGNIELDAPIQIGAGNKILSSDGNSIQFGNGLSITGSVVLSGTVDGVDIANLNGLFNNYTSSTDGAINVESLRINSLESFTASIDDTYASDSDVSTLRGDLNTYTSSNDGRVDSLETASASLIARVGDVETLIGELDETYATDTDVSTLRGDLNTYTSSNETDKLNIDGRLDSVENFTSSVDGQVRTDFNTYTSSNDSNISTLNTFKTSIDGGLEITGSNVTIKGNLLVKGTETRVDSTTVDLSDNIISLNGTGASDAGIEVRDVTSPGILSGSLLWDGVTNYWKGGTKGNEERLLVNTDLNNLDGRLDSIETTTSSFDGRLDSIETTTSSLDGRLDSVEVTTSSFDGRLDSIETTTSSLKGQVSSLESFTASIDDTYASDLDVSTLRTDLNTYTSSNDTNIGTLDGRVDSLETESGSVSGRLENIEITTASLVSDLNILDGRVDSLETTSGSHDGRLDSLESNSGSYLTTYNNEYTTGATFNAVDGVITHTRNDGDTFTVDIDGRFLPLSGGTISSSNTYSLKLENTTNGGGTGIEFSDNPNSGTQRGYITHYHSDTASYGSGASMVLSTTEASFTVLVDGKLMYKEGIYSKPSTGTGAGTRKDTNWDAAYGWGNHASVGYLTSYNNEYTTGVTFNTTNGIITFTRNDGDTFTVDLDGRYLTSVLTPQINNWWNGGFISVGTDGVMEVGKYLDFHASNTGTIDFDVRLTAGSGTLTLGGVFHATGGNSTNWNTAYGWGNHASAGYISSFTDTNEFVSGATFNTGNGVITFTRNNGGDTFTVDIDGRHVLKSGDVMSGTLEVPRLQMGNTSFGPSGDQNHVHFVGTALIPNTTTTSSNSNMGTSAYRWKGVYGGLGDFSGIVTASGGNSTNWNTAYGWGNHASVGYLTSYNNEYTTGATFNSGNGIITFTRNDGDTFTLNIASTLTDVTVTGGTYNSDTQVLTLTKSDGVTLDVGGFAIDTDVNWYVTGSTFNTVNGVVTIKGKGMSDVTVDLDGRYLTSFTETDPIFNASPSAGITDVNISNWNTAYGWGDHSVAGYTGDQDLSGYLLNTTDTLNGTLTVNGEGYSTGGWGFGTSETPVGRIFNNSGVFSVRAETGRQISFGNVTNGEFVRINGTGHVGIGEDNPSHLLTLKQSTDSNGLKIWGYDDQSTSYGEMYLDAAGNLQIRQQSGDGSSGYIQIQAQTYLELSAGAFTYTTGKIRIYDSGQLDFGNSGDYKIKYDDPTDVLNIHTNDNLGITIDSVGNVEIDGTITASGYNSTNWNTAYGWGNHASVGYLTSFTETDTLDSVTDRGATTSNIITVGGVNLNDGNSIIEEASGNAFRLKTSTGYIDIGSKNSGWIHFEGNRPYYFGTSYSAFDGDVRPYTNNTRSLGSSTHRWAGIYANGGDSSQWNTAYGWGNHASAGYISSFTDTNEFTTGVTFNAGNGVLTFTRNNGGDTFTVDLDGRFLDTRAQVHSELFSTGGDANDYTEFGIYRNYASNGPIGSHNTILHVSQTDGNYGFQLGGSTVTNGDGLYFRNFAGNDTITGSTWYHIATRDWVGDQNYVTTSGYNNTNWNTAYGWGNHASAGYITSFTNTNEFTTGVTFNTGNGVLTFTRNNGGDTFTVDIDGRYLTSFTETDTLDSVLGRNNTSTRTMTIGSTLNMTADGGSNHTASRIYLNSHNDARGLGVFMSGVGSTWYAGTPYGNHAGSYIISRKGTVSDESTANPTHALLTLTNTGNLSVDGTLTASGYNDSNWNTAYGWGDHSVAGYTGDQDLSGYLTTTGKAADSNLLDGIDSTDVLHGNANGTNDSVTTDLDGLDKTGFYTSSSFVTKPSSVSNWMYVNHIKLYNSNPNYQKQIGYDTYDDRMWLRTKNNNTWTSWKQVWNEGDFANNSGNWNTAYGWGNHASAGYLTSYNDEYVTGASFNNSTAVLTFTRNDGDTFNVTLLDTLSDVTVTGGTYTAGTQTLSLTKSDGNTVDVSGFAIDTDVNWYINSATFNTSTGVITATGPGSAGFTVDIDGRFLLDTTDTFTGSLSIDGDIRGTGQQLILNAGESYSYATGQGNEYVYVNAEQGLEVNSETGNWSGGWAARKTALLRGDLLRLDGEDLTKTNIQNFKTAYGWGNHASYGYVTGGPYLPLSGKSVDSDRLDGIDSTQFLRSDTSDTHTATLTVNGQFIFNSSTNSNYQEGIRLNLSTTNWGGAVIGGVRDSISGITDAWWVARNPSKDFVISYGTSANSGGLHLPYNSTALSYKNSRIWNESDFANNSSNWNMAYGWGDHNSSGYARLGASNSFTDSYNEFGNGTGSVSNDGSWNARVNVAGTSHARLDVKSVSDGIITSMYSHIGNGAGKIGTMSNHPLKLMVGGTDRLTLDSSSNLTITGTMNSNLVTTNQVTTSKLNLSSGGSYEGSIVFGSNDTWHTGIRQHDDADAELRIWAKSSNGMIFLSTGYDGEPADISRPTDGLVVGPNNKVGIGNFSVNGDDPNAKLHIKGSTAGETIFNLEGTSGQLFSITDDLTGDLFSVSDASGVPIFNVNANGTVSIDSLGLLTVGGSITGNSFIKSGGTSTQFLKADGSVDSTTYLSSLPSHSHTFASLTSKPTTLSGYGITDAATSAQGTNADTAHGWGDHGLSVQDKVDIGNLSGTNTGDQDLSGYLTSYSETDTLSDVIGRGNTTTGSISFTGTGANTGIKFNSTIVSNDGFGIRVNGTSNAGELEFYSTDDDTEPFVFRHYTSGQDGTGGSVEWFRIGAGGNISTPGTVSASNFSGTSSGTNTGDQDLSGYLTTGGKAADSEKLDGLDSTSFLRSDADDSFSGALISTARDRGIFGTYDSYKTDQIWSMGISYKNHASGTDFGNLYGLAYKHTNNTTGGSMAGGHQMVWCDNGTPKSAMGNSIWTGGNVIAAGGNSTEWNAAYDWGDHSDYSYATETYVGTQISNLVDSAPGTLDTLNELAAALGDDPNFATTITNSIATKLPLAGGVMSGNIGRSAHNNGYLVGGYNNIGASASATNPIFTIGTSYLPAVTTLGNMYGIGYTRADASFMGIASGSGWGMYVAADGDARVWLDGGTGNIVASGTLSASGYNDGNWNTAYGWGNHASGGYASSSHTHAASDITSGTFAAARFATSTRYDIGLITGYSSQSRDKLRVWDSSEYSIGMKNGYDYGHIGSGEYAMSFQMSNSDGRGWWWGDTAHNDDQGAASLTTQGKMVIAKSLSIGQGELITNPSDTPLYVEGTTAGETVFDVQGTQGQLFSITDDLTGDLFTVSDISGIPILSVNSLGTVTVDDTLYVTGDVIAYYASDKRLKENIKPISNPLDKIKMIGGYEFDWNGISKNEGHDVGVIAQEIEEVLPELVGTRGDGYKGVKYEKLTALLIEAIKDQQIQIDELKSKLNK